MKKTLIKKSSKVLTVKKSSKKRKRKNPDLEIIRKQLEKLITIPGETEYKKIVLMSDPYLFGILEYNLVWQNWPKSAPPEWGGVANGNWVEDKENFTLTVKYETVRSLQPIYSRPSPGIRETFEKYKFNINDVIKVDGRKIYLNKNPELVTTYNAGKRR